MKLTANHPVSHLKLVFKVSALACSLVFITYGLVWTMLLAIRICL